MDCSQSLMLKAVLFIELLIQLRWLNKTKKRKKKKKGKQQQHGARDGCCAERSQPWPCASEERVSAGTLSSLVGRHPALTRHAGQHMENQSAPELPVCNYQMTSSESVTSEDEKNVNISPMITADSLHWRLFFFFFLFVFSYENSVRCSDHSKGQN